MERAITGSVSPSAALDPVALPSASRSKRGASIAGIPSFGGPPDLIPANGTLCLEKSVRGHSKRQLIGSADKVPRLASTGVPRNALNAINPMRLGCGYTMADDSTTSLLSLRWMKEDRSVCGGDRAPVQEIASGQGRHRSEHTNSADLPDENHQARILGMKQPQPEITESGCRQAAEGGCYVRGKRRAAAEHNGHSDCWHRADDNDRREAGPIRLQR